ncbi:MAG: acetolactate synthase large subunit [Chloroflexi bacterium]|nr:acetolactate synthase large subunit [Chloroflexota bacterium]
MKGAEALLRTLLNGGVDVCFTNPGTSEMQFVAAVDRVPQMRAILALYEGVVTGAADGYARMADKPAATLLHLGPGLANGLANIHNARKALSPMVNIVGEHATYHVQYDAPLTSDIAGIAKPVSAWVCTTQSAGTIARDAAEAVQIARQTPGRIATLITPADATWDETDGPATVAAPAAPAAVDDAAILDAMRALTSGEPCMLMLDGFALRAQALEYAGRIARQTGARLLSPTFYPRMQRGAGRVNIEPLPYFAELASQKLQGLKHLILVGAKPPVAFFAYPGKPSWLTPDGVQIHELATRANDLPDALMRLADAVGAKAPAATQTLLRPDLPSGELKPSSMARALAALLPEQAIVVDESGTSSLPGFGMTASASPHDWLVSTGGAIGWGPPVATGAAVACPDRKVLNLQADGSMMYTLQALWTQAREQLNVTTVIYNNRAYRILGIEFGRTGSGAMPGAQAAPLLSLENPQLDFVSLAKGMGVPAVRVTTAEEYSRALAAMLKEQGPNLIEAVI